MNCNTNCISPFILKWSEKLNNAVHYLYCRYVKQTHLVPTYLPKGYWYDSCDKLIYSMFGLLVDYVEVECTYLQLLSESNSYKITNPCYKVKRSKKLGLKYIEWETSLPGEFGRQAYAAKEQLILYTWWTKVRPNRKNPYESTGYSKYCEKIDFSISNYEDSELQNLLRKVREIRADYDAEDTEMMIRLVRIREHLWT